MEVESNWETMTVPWSEGKGLELAPTILYRGLVKEPTLVRRGMPAQYTWWWILDGACELESAGRAYSLRPGEWVFIPAGAFRVQWFEEGSRIVSVNFYCHWAGRIPVVRFAEPLVGTAETVPGLFEVADAICDGLQGQGGQGQQSLSGYSPTAPGVLQLRSRLAVFAEKLLEYATRQGGVVQELVAGDVRLEKVLLELRTEPKAGPLPYERWGEVTGLGRSQLERLARRDTGSGLHAYRDRFLLLQACHLLATRPVRVKELAEQFGFVDSAHFCRWIRQRTRHSPLQLRNAPV